MRAPPKMAMMKVVFTVMPTSPDDAPITKAVLKAELRTEIDALEERLLERMEKIETNLLRAFRNWATGSETRMKVNEILVHSFSDRLTAAEERISEIERRITK